MTDFYQDFIRKCNNIGKTPSAVAIEIGLTKSAVNRWKNGSFPTDATAEQIKAYFAKERQQVEENQVQRVCLNDAQVEQEIARLKESPYVALGRKEEYIRNRRRAYMYKLRDLEKKGKALAAAGITLEMLENMDEEA